MSDLIKTDMKEKEAAEAIKVDGNLYQFLTEEIMDNVYTSEKDDASRAVLEKYWDGYRDIFEGTLVSVYYNRATAFFHLGQYKDALADINETLRRAPDLNTALEWRQLLNMHLEQ